ncbi:AfsR/SARP family transcriptional regulator [Flindersiella endophytica]
MKFRILGQLEVFCHDRDFVDLGAPKQRAAMGALLLNANQTVSAERLIESVWWRPSTAAAANLRLYLAGIRRILRHRGEADSRLQTVRASGYRLRVEPGELDLDTFDALTEASDDALRAGRRASAADSLEQALNLWRGHVLDGVSFGPALEPTVMLIEERRIAATERWARLRFELGEPEKTVGPLRALVSEHPMRERLWAQLMLAQCCSGQPGEALAAYAKLRTILVEELGTDPSPKLQRLHERILRGDTSQLTLDPATLDPAAVGADSSRAGEDARARTNAHLTGPAPAFPDVLMQSHQLPASTSTLCGRAGELARLRDLLTDGRRGPVVVAVDGVAGVGKSALALEAARLSASHFPDGQLYVDLQGASADVAPLQPIQALGRLLHTLGVRPCDVPGHEAEAAALFRSLMARRRILVLLDNAGSIGQVRPLLPGGPDCAVLLTSRELPAGLGGAVRVPLGLLAPADSTAVLGQLCGPERVAADPSSAERLAALCGQLPLALHVAGARLAAQPGWSIATLADRLDAAPRRLDELVVGDLAIRSSLEPTYQRLSEPSRTAFRRLGLLRSADFPSWALAPLLDLPAADTERLLEDLLAVHLVETSGAGELRYHLHDLIRLYAQEQAATDPPWVRSAAARRLLGACLSLAEQAEHNLSADFLGTAKHSPRRWSLPRATMEKLTADPKLWFQQEYAFLLAAVDDGLDHRNTGLAGSLAAALTAYFRIGNHLADWWSVQGRALVAAKLTDDRHTAAKLHRGLGELNTIQDRYPEAIRHFEAAQEFETDGDPNHAAAIASGLGNLYRLRGEYGPALHAFTQAKDLSNRSGNLNGLAHAISGIGVIRLERGQLTEAADCFETCLRLSRQAGYLPGEATAQRGLGHLQRRHGRYDQAAQHFLAAQRISEGIGDRLGAAHAACWLGEMRVRQGRPAEGRRLLARCLWTQREFDNAWGEAAALWALATAQLAAGRAELALRRAEQAVAIWRRLGSPYWLATGIETLADICDVLGQREAARGNRTESAGLRARLRQQDGNPSFSVARIA